MDKLERMNELIAEIKEADVAYYKYDAPKLSDREYDARYNELLCLEAEIGGNPVRLSHSEGAR